MAVEPLINSLSYIFNQFLFNLGRGCLVQLIFYFILVKQFGLGAILSFYYFLIFWILILRIFLLLLGASRPGGSWKRPKEGFKFNTLCYNARQCTIAHCHKRKNAKFLCCAIVQPCKLPFHQLPTFVLRYSVLPFCRPYQVWVLHYSAATTLQHNSVFTHVTLVAL